ncbi:TauD-domain-containing protein [Amylocystis lapponica]|nr:TauD-domain-containing protein [Amylocystis lapponica]
MAPVATADNVSQNGPDKPSLKAAVQVFNPFYSPFAGDDSDSSYQHAQYKVCTKLAHRLFPRRQVGPLEEQAVTERPASAAAKVQHLTPAIGTEITGIDLRQLTDAQKDELALLVAERGVVFFRDQEINIHEQLALALVYNDGSRRPDTSAFTKLELWHSDVTYEYGGDTIWSSGYALYSSFSPGFQKYLEGLYAVHSAVAQADGARAAGTPCGASPSRRFTRRIVGLPKAESDAILHLLFNQISENPDFQVRRDALRHFDFWPHVRHALRATPHGEKPLSVAKDRQQEIWAQLGASASVASNGRPRGYND